MPHKPPRKPDVFPYWKVQFYNPVSLTWMDIQKKYNDKAEAEKNARLFSKPRFRLVQIDGAASDRHILPEIEFNSNKIHNVGD
ncbi:MAG: hypothetical protein MUO43_03340 [Desulfobacterales bacterium]|nr:hypothetical protein [Desulfobacterales bacterium]